MNASLSKILIATILGISAMTLQGCSDEDVALGAGVIIGVIIADPHDHGCCHHHHEQPPRYHEPHHWSAQVATAIALTPAQKMAMSYDISESAANKVLNSLVETKKGNTQALSEIGLDKNDLVDLLNGHDLSNNSISKMSFQLELSEQQSADLVEKISADVRLAQIQKPAPSYIPGH